MKLHEYQAKALLARYGVPVPRGDVAKMADKAGRIAESLGGKVVVKAQVHAGGRGKAGGIKLANSPRRLSRPRDRCSARSSSPTRARRGSPSTPCSSRSKSTSRVSSTSAR